MVEQFRSAIVDGVRYDPTEFKGENLGEPGVEGSGGVKPTLDEKELCNRHGMAMSSVLHFLSRVFKRPEKTISKFCNLETLGFRQESPWQLCLQVYGRIICEDNEDFGMYRYTCCETTRMALFISFLFYLFLSIFLLVFHTKTQART